MDPYVGEIRMFAGNFPPLGWEFCNGQLLNISEYDTLFMLLGTTYGGDGQTTFALPNLQGRVLLHQGQNPATHTNYMMGQAAGVESVTLTSNQMPAHTHPPAAAMAATKNELDGAIWAQSAAKQYATTADKTLNPALIGPAGGNQPHDNMMPFLTVSYIIATNGIYPQQG